MLSGKYVNLINIWKLNRFSLRPHSPVLRLQHCIAPRCPPIRTVSTNSSHKQNKIEDADKPIKYSTSAAYDWRAEFSRKGADTTERLSYEMPVIFLSLGIFMVYFCVLREESDIDLELDKSLYQRIDGLERQQLSQLIKYNKQHNNPVADLEGRLEEIEKEEEREAMSGK